jgi:hypothetical protein
MAPQVGLEPTTDRLTADSSTTELLRNNNISFLNFVYYRVSPSQKVTQGAARRVQLAAYS